MGAAAVDWLKGPVVKTVESRLRRCDDVSRLYHPLRDAGLSSAAAAAGTELRTQK